MIGAPTGFLATSVARHMIARMHATHERRRIAVFSGPPGIGKTTAVDEFRARARGEVAVVKVAKRGAKEVFVLQHVLEAVRVLAGVGSLGVPSSIWELRHYLTRTICEWAHIDPLAVRRGEPLPDIDKRLTLVFDEAQNLSREAIEILRFWNDADRCYSPFPIGLVFVGNSEFSLAVNSTGTSTLSEAVADRAFHIQVLEYDDVADEDVRLFLDASGVSDRSVQAQITRQLRSQRAPRSFRRIGDLVEELKEIAGSGPITVDTIREAL